MPAATKTWWDTKRSVATADVTHATTRRSACHVAATASSGAPSSSQADVPLERAENGTTHDAAGLAKRSARTGVASVRWAATTTPHESATAAWPTTNATTG